MDIRLREVDVLLAALTGQTRAQVKFGRLANEIWRPIKFLCSIYPPSFSVQEYLHPGHYIPITKHENEKLVSSSCGRRSEGRSRSQELDFCIPQYPSKIKENLRNISVKPYINNLIPPPCRVEI